MTILALGSVALCSCGHSCPEDESIVEDVRLELRGPDRAGRPVFVQAPDGALIVEGTTDAEGVFVVSEARADAILTVDLGAIRGNGDVTPTLASYVGLVSDETLILELPRPPLEENGRAAVTVRFDSLGDPRVIDYHVNLGRSCGASGAIPQVPEPGSVVEVVVEARCVGVAANATVVAHATSGRYVAAASAPIEVADGEAITVDLGEWHTSTTEVRLTGPFEPSTFIWTNARLDGITEFTNQDPVPIDGDVVSLPQPPELFDEVDVYVSGIGEGPGRSSYHVVLTAPTDASLDAGALLPRMTGIDASSLERGAPTVTYDYDGPAHATLISYLASGNDAAFEPARLLRLGIASGASGCIHLPPLPPGYDALLPADDDPVFEVAGDVSVLYGPGFDPAIARRELGPLGTGRLPGVAIFESGRGYGRTFRAVPDPD